MDELKIEWTKMEPSEMMRIIDSNLEVQVILRPDGTIEFGPTYKPEEAARIFWEYLAADNPLHARVKELEAEVQRLRFGVASR